MGCAPHVTIQCPNTDVCRNNQCLWRQRDIFGRNLMYIPPEQFPDEAEQQAELRAELEAKYGPAHFPEWTCTVGTNCVYAICQEASC